MRYGCAIALAGLIVGLVGLAPGLAVPGGLPVVAQTVDQRKAEADRLLQQGIQQFQTSQFEAAFQSWQQALQLYRAIKDRRGEGYALGGLGNAYTKTKNHHYT
jgi:Flp pilus assembly protein TadD